MRRKGRERRVRKVEGQGRERMRRGGWVVHDMITL